MPIFYSIYVGKNNKEREREREREREIKKEYLNKVVKKIELLMLGEL